MTAQSPSMTTSASSDGSPQVVLSVAYSADGNLLASAGHSGCIQVLDVAMGEKMHELASIGESISSVTFSPKMGNGGLMLAAAERREGLIRLWNISTGTEVRCLHAQNVGGVNAVAFSCDGCYLVGGYGNVHQEIDAPEHTQSSSNAVMVWNISEHPGSLRLQIADGHNLAVTTVACNPTSSRFAASGSIDGTIKIWDILDGKEEALLLGHGGSVWSVCFSPDGSLLASASSDRYPFLSNCYRDARQPFQYEEAGIGVSFMPFT